MKCCDAQQDLFELKNKITNFINRLDDSNYTTSSKNISRIMLDEFKEPSWGNDWRTEDA